MKNFSEHLKDIRKLKGLTQKQIAKGIGVDERVYQRYEYGNVKPSFDKLIALADYFDVSVDYLIGRTDKPKGGTE